MNSKNFIILLAIEVSLIYCNDYDIVSVTTNNGVVNGRTQVYLEKRVNVFLGIPYAEPPINQLRFKKPIAVKNWTQPLNATQQPNPCYQRSNYPTFLNRNFSEDCLYLNIWQPINNSDSNNDSKAVMFFLHGGGLVQGSANEYAYEGQFLSTIGDVVVVVINYRLGVFGFFYTDTDDAPGNVGFWDMILALQWVSDNIMHFGGDPNRVTLFGSSGGSIAASLIIVSRHARHLYNQAILMSGAIHNSWVYNKTQSKQNWLNRAKTIGCALETDNAFNSQIINCLIDANASDLVNIAVAQITIDGTFLDKSPVELLESGDYKKNINILIGTVENEGSGSAANTPINNRTYAQSFQFLVNSSSTLPVYATINGTEVAQLYFALISPNTTDYDYLRLTETISYGDGNLGCETLYFARAILKNDRINNKVYQYYYTGKPLMPDDYYHEWLNCVEWKGTCHRTDLYPVFGMPFKYNTSSESEIYDSTQAIEIFTHFAKFGYPSPQHGIDWPKYYMLNSYVVTPYFQLNNTHQSVSSFFDYGLKTTECEYLWRKSIYVAVPNSSHKIYTDFHLKCVTFIFFFFSSSFLGVN